MLKKITCLFLFLLCGYPLLAQTNLLPPSGLMVDLVAQSNYQSVNGYAIQPSASNLLNPAIQSVLIGNKQPAFSWEVNSSGTNVIQEAYQIRYLNSK